jgi:hypothetical protein
MARAQKVAKVGVKKVDGYLYFVDKDGDVARVAMNRGGKRTTSRRKTTKKRVTKRKVTKRKTATKRRTTKRKTTKRRR